MSDSQFNDDELNPPNWIDQQFIQNVLRSSEKDDTIKVIDFKLSPATAVGDHYATIMFRANIDYLCKDEKTLSKSIIIKAMAQQEGHKKELFKESKIFKTEIQMYLETLPKIEELLRKAGDDTKLGPKMLYHSMQPQQVIVFEDLCPQGYTVIRERLLDLEEIKVVILKLAKLHAVSYKLGLESDPLITRYTEGFFGIPNFIGSDYAQKGIELFTKMLSTLEGYESYVPLLKELDKDLVTRCVDIFNAAQHGGKGIFVLNHGDFHLKNFMFRKNKDGTTDDVLLLDFQLCFYGPATVDLTYATFTFFNEDARRNHRDEIIYFYVTNFLETLRKIEFTKEAPTLADFCIELIKNRKFEIFMVTTFFPLFYAFTHPKDFDIPMIMQSADYRSQFYFLPQFIEEMKEALPKYLHKGYLH